MQSHVLDVEKANYYSAWLLHENFWLIFPFTVEYYSFQPFNNNGFHVIRSPQQNLHDIRNNVVVLLNALLPQLDLAGISLETADVDNILQQIIEVNSLKLWVSELSNTENRVKPTQRPCFIIVWCAFMGAISVFQTLSNLRFIRQYFVTAESEFTQLRFFGLFRIQRSHLRCEIYF